MASRNPASSFKLLALTTTKLTLEGRIDGLKKQLDRVLDQIADEHDRLDGPFVRVSFLENPHYHKKYTYRDTSGSCAVGDIVEVDARGERKQAVVRQLGRTDIQRRARRTDFKPVLAVYRKEPTGTQVFLDGEPLHGVQDVSVSFSCCAEGQCLR